MLELQRGRDHPADSFPGPSSSHPQGSDKFDQSAGSPGRPAAARHIQFQGDRARQGARFRRWP